MRGYFVPAKRVFVQLLFLQSSRAYSEEKELPGNNQGFAQITLI